MATRSTIAVVDNEGKVHQVYCHWDGYPSWNGYVLRKSYNDLESALELVSFGDISSLKEKCIPDPELPHDFQDDVTVFYKRDRGEDGVEAKVYDNIQEYYKKFQREEYNYLFVDGKWHLLNEKKLTELTDEILDIENCEKLEELLSNVDSKYFTS